jgi:hypothetical protein
VPTCNGTTLFIFLDESGNLDFSKNGTRFWSMTALCTYEPVQGREMLWDLMYTLAHQGTEIEYFHATEDTQEIRNEVFKRILTLPDSYEVHSILADKPKAHPSLYRKTVTRRGKTASQKDEAPFYGLISRTVLKYIFRRARFSRAECIVVILSSIFDGEKRAAITSSLKTYLKNECQKPFHLYFRANKADINCQIADYLGWAVARFWEKGDNRSLALVKHKINTQFQIFESGTRLYYEI